MTEGQISKPLSRGQMLAITAVAFAIGSLIAFGAVLPAEFNWDPTGLGRITGLGRLWAPREVAFDTSTTSAAMAREYSSGFRSDIIEIPMQRDGNPAGGDEIEYKVRMSEGGTLI